MRHKARYQIEDSLMKMAALARVSVQGILRRAGLPPDHLARNPTGVTAAQFFDIWCAAEQELGTDALVVDLSVNAAKGIFATPVFAFSCSPDVWTGLQRLSVFKPLVAPVVMTLAASDAGKLLTIRAAEAEAPLPASLAAFEIMYLVEMIRIHTGKSFCPVSVILPGIPVLQQKMEAYLGCPVMQRGDTVGLLLSEQDAKQVLISENAALWQELERKLNLQLRHWEGSQPVSERVRAALMELLPSGQSTIDAVCRHLASSRRSLQRALREDAVTFRMVLESTREHLARRYLSQGDMSIEEIAYLLAFRDPNSFYRAFNNWTGMTPAKFRQQAEA